MHTILKRLHKLADEELLALSEAVDREINRRLGREEGGDESARRRAFRREQSYRRRVGSAAPPIVAVGLGRARKDRRAA